MKYEIPVMVEQGGGSIVNTASVAGMVAFENMAPYVASKHGVVGLTKVAALEYATAGVRINALCPGVVRTALLDTILAEVPAMAARVTATTPMDRVAQPEEMAEAAVWLCSGAASFVTGSSLVADGGLTLK